MITFIAYLAVTVTRFDHCHLESGPLYVCLCQDWMVSEDKTGVEPVPDGVR